jgi:hypothetical protein
MTMPEFPETAQDLRMTAAKTCDRTRSDINGDFPKNPTK